MKNRRAAFGVSLVGENGEQRQQIETAVAYRPGVVERRNVAVAIGCAFEQTGCLAVEAGDRLDAEQAGGGVDVAAQTGGLGERRTVRE